MIKLVPEKQIILRISDNSHLKITNSKTVRNYLTKAGDLFLTAVNQELYELEWSSDSDEIVKTFHIYVNNRLFTQTAIVAGMNIKNVEINDGSCLNDPLTKQLYIELSNEMLSSSIEDSLFIESVEQMIAVQLLRKHSVTKPLLPEHNNKLSPQRFSHLIKYINERLNQSITLSALAAIVFMSPYHSCKVFKNTTGLSPYEYVITERMKKAKQLLKKGALYQRLHL